MYERHRYLDVRLGIGDRIESNRIGLTQLNIHRFVVGQFIARFYTKTYCRTVEIISDSSPTVDARAK